MIVDICPPALPEYTMLIQVTVRTYNIDAGLTVTAMTTVIVRKAARCLVIAVLTIDGQ